MAITFTNKFKLIMDTIKEILTDETNLPVYTDPDFKTRATQFFNLTPITSNSLNRYNIGENREYAIQIRYYLKKGAYEKHRVLDYTMAMGERIIRLFNNTKNSTYTALSSVGFDDGLIETVDYQPDRTPEEDDEELNIVEFTFVGRVTESY